MKKCILQEILWWTCLLIKPTENFVQRGSQKHVLLLCTLKGMVTIELLHFISFSIFSRLLLDGRGPYLAMDTLFYTGIIQSFNNVVLGPRRPEYNLYCLENVLLCESNTTEQTTKCWIMMSLRIFKGFSYPCFHETSLISSLSSVPQPVTCV